MKRFQSKTVRRTVSVVGAFLLLSVAVALTASSQPEVGVKPGDQVTYSFQISGAPPGPLPTSVLLEILSVQGTDADLRITLTLADATEQINTVTLDIATGQEAGGTSGLAGLIIPANLTTDDPVTVAGLGPATIDGETTRVYAGAGRAVVHTTFSALGTNSTYYWDKQTGVMMEVSVSGLIDATVRAVATNMWGPDAPFFTQVWFLAVIAVIAVVAVVAAVLLLRRRSPPP